MHWVGNVDMNEQKSDVVNDSSLDINEVKMMPLQHYISLPKFCIYALICDETKRVLVGYSKNLLTSISRLNQDLETPKYMQLKNDIDKVYIKVLEVGVQDKDRKIKVNNYVNNYLSLGYTLYCSSNLVKYTVHTEIMTISKNIFLVAFLKDKRCNKIIVGIFKTKNELNKFINTYYPNNVCTGIYYSNNIYTNNYLKYKDVEYAI